MFLPILLMFLQFCPLRGRKVSSTGEYCKHLRYFHASETLSPRSVTLRAGGIFHVFFNLLRLCFPTVSGAESSGYPTFLFLPSYHLELNFIN